VISIYIQLLSTYSDKNEGLVELNFLEANEEASLFVTPTQITSIWRTTCRNKKLALSTPRGKTDKINVN
jgi:hypothetical protein